MNDETGEKDEKAHKITFLNHLDLLEMKESDKKLVDDSTPAVTLFNELVHSDKDLIGILGAIEYIYCDISARISNTTSHLTGKTSPHYDTHQVLDIKHAQDLCTVVDMTLKDQIDAKKAEVILQRAIKYMSDLYVELDNVICESSDLLFANVYEDFRIETAFWEKNQRALCIASGGDTILALLNKFEDNEKGTIDIVDCSSAQVEYTKILIRDPNNHNSVNVDGLYDLLFRPLSSCYNLEIAITNDRIVRLFGKEAIGGNYNANFRKIFEKAITKAKLYGGNRSNVLLYGKGKKEKKKNVEMITRIYAIIMLEIS